MLWNLKVLIDSKGFDVTSVNYDTEEFLLKSGITVKKKDVLLLRGSGQYECPRRCGELTREIFEGDTIEWVDDRYFKKRKGIVHWYAEKGYFGVEVQETEDIILLCQIARPDIISRAYEE